MMVFSFTHMMLLYTIYYECDKTKETVQLKKENVQQQCAGARPLQDTSLSEGTDWTGCRGSKKEDRWKSRFMFEASWLWSIVRHPQIRRGVINLNYSVF